MQSGRVLIPVEAGREVTVLLASFNGEAFLSPQLASLDNQKHRPSLVLVRDDGSGDNTVKKLREWAKSSELKVQFLEDGERLGACGSFLRLLRHVETPLFAFCDQDDVWHPDRLERGVEALADHTGEIAAWCADGDMVDAEGRQLGKTALRHRFGPGALQPTFRHLLLMNAAIGATMTGTRALAEAAVALTGDEHQPFMHDWFCALLAANAGRLTIDPVPAIDYRRHDDAETGQPRSWRERFERLLTSGVGERTAKVERAALNAEPLLDAEFLTPANRDALERLAAVGAQAVVARRDLARLAAVGIRPTPRLRELAWYR